MIETWWCISYSARPVFVLFPLLFYPPHTFSNFLHPQPFALQTYLSSPQSFWLFGQNFLSQQYCPLQHGSLSPHLIFVHWTASRLPDLDTFGLLGRPDTKNSWIIGIRETIRAPLKNIFLCLFLMGTELTGYWVNDPFFTSRGAARSKVTVGSSCNHQG